MKKHFPLILILVLATILRYYHNTLISLWHDEAFSALMIRYPWREMFYRLGLDVHPPMYYIFLRFWHDIFGDSLFSLRSFSVFCGVGTVIAGYLFTKEAFKNEKAALWAALLIAINPFQLQYVTEARMYTMGALFALLAAYFLVKSLHKQQELDHTDPNMPNTAEMRTIQRSMFWNLLGLTLTFIIIIYTHYYLFFTAAALIFYTLVYLIYHHRKNVRKYLPYVVAYGVGGLAFVPWLKTFLFQYRQVNQSYWIPPMDKWSVPATFWDMLLGFARDTSKLSTQIFLVLVTLFSLYLFYRFLRKTNSFHKWLVALAILAPFGGAMLFALLAFLKGSHSSVFLDRYFLFASIFYSVMLGVWLKEIPWKWLSYSLLVIYCALNITAYIHYWQQLDVKTKPGMAAAAKYLQANVTPKDKIFVGSSFMFFNYEYYNKTPVKPLLFTGGTIHAADIPHYAGSALLSDDLLVPDFKTGAHSGDTVWLVWTNGFGASKPGVPGNWVQIDERSYAEVRPYVGTNVYVTEYRVN